MTDIEELRKQFRPNLTPRQIFSMGSFGGTYWRPIKSGVTGKSYSRKHKKYKWLDDIPEDKLSSEECDISVNKYKVRVGTSLKFWEKKKWITKYDPYGWVQWYCNYYEGRRTPDDARQIKRWLQLAGPNGRFRKWLISQIKKSRKSYNDISVSPKIRQTLQHWGYKLTSADYKRGIKK